MNNDHPYQPPSGFEPQKSNRVLVWAAIVGVVSLPVAAFCLFGFLATFEPTDRPEVYLAFRVGYGIVGLGSLVITAALFALAFRSSSSAK